MGSVLIAGYALGQGRELDAVRHFLEECAAEMAEQGKEGSLEEVMEHFERLALNPMDINRASRGELERLYILSDFQVESLLEYRSSSGNILSFAELEMISGFHKGVVDMLRPFVFFGKGEVKSVSKYNSALLLKWWWKEPEEEYVGEPYSLQLRYRGELSGKLSLGFMLEKDAGEKAFAKGRVPLGDFFSFHLAAKGLRLSGKWEVADVVLGDYAIRYGQGLTVWNAFSIKGDQLPQSAFKRGDAVMPYGSSDESGFFRGGAVTVKRKLGKFRELEVSAFFSRKNVDAAVKDGMYTSLPTDGLHNTEGSLERRKTMGEMAYGGNVVYRGVKSRLGINWIGYGYSLHNGRKVYDYNKYQMYDGWHGNVSVDGAFLLGTVRVFGEVALDYGMDAALLCGVQMRLGSWETALLYRNYSKGYIAPYAGAASSVSSCSNQNGASAVFNRQIRDLNFSGGASFTYYPWKRYRVGPRSSEYGLWVKCGALSGENKWSAKLYGRWNSYTATPKFGAKVRYGRGMAGWLDVNLRGEIVTADNWQIGGAAGLELHFNMFREKLRLVAGCAYYDCRDWDCRLYMYEYDLPSTYTSALMYGTGWGWYSLLSCKIGRNCSIYAKEDEETKVKIGLRMRFF